MPMILKMYILLLEIIWFIYFESKGRIFKYDEE